MLTEKELAEGKIRNICNDLQQRNDHNDIRDMACEIAGKFVLCCVTYLQDYNQVYKC